MNRRPANPVRRTPAQIKALAEPRPSSHGRTRRAIAEPSRLHGVRPDRTWVRPASEQTRPELTNHELVDAIEWQHVRCGQWMGATDVATLAELDVRAWAWGEVTEQRLWALPTWADELIPTRRGVGFARFLAVLLAAYRAGAVGVLLGYHECMALVGTNSRDTWRRWCRDMEAAGLARIVQTWRPDPTAAELVDPHAGDGAEPLRVGRARAHAKLLYRLGPAFEAAAGPGLCVNATGGEGEVPAAWAARMAGGAYRKARRARDARREYLWALNACDPRYMKAPSSEAVEPSGVPPKDASGFNGAELDAKPDPSTGAGSNSDHALDPCPGSTTIGEHSPSPLRGGVSAPAPEGPTGKSKARPHGRPVSAVAPAIAESVPNPEVRGPDANAGASEGDDPGPGRLRAWLERRYPPRQEPPPRIEPVPPERKAAALAELVGGLRARGLPVELGTPDAGDDDDPPPEKRRRPRRVQCGDCRGTGHAGEWPCSRCDGAGKRQSEPPPEPCGACGGGGIDHDTWSTCGTCGGCGHA